MSGPPGKQRIWACFAVTLLLLLPTCVPVAGSVEEGRFSDKLSLLRVRASLRDPFGILSSWNASDSDPCSWFSVLCDSRRRVVALNISGGSPGKFSSFFPRKQGRGGKLYGILSASIGSLTELRVLSLPFNEIYGSIPPEISRLFRLEVLDLSYNRFSGPIPPLISRCRKLRHVNLVGNRLTGTFASDFGSRRRSRHFRREGNSVAGETPADLALLHSATRQTLLTNGLSSQIRSESGRLTVSLLKENKLCGKIRSKLWRLMADASLEEKNLFGVMRAGSAERSTLRTLLQATSSPPYAFAPPPPSASVQANNGFTSIEIASITSASAIVSVLLALLLLLLYTRRFARRSAVAQGPLTKAEVVTFCDMGVKITFGDVARGTGGFNPSNCIGHGGFGSTYKAEISPGLLVAIKRLSVGRFQQGARQFEAEIRTLGKIQHPNLVTLIGFHSSETEMFLIYNYLPGGNLEKFIQERSKYPADWRMLHKIALDVAEALAYLHDVCAPRVLHRDIKPSNILLDNNFKAYLSDFGLARLLGASETHATTEVAGTFGYVAPEYAMTSRVSDKADVYSYGVVLLELLSDKKALDPSFSSYGNGFNIVGWAAMLLRQGRAREFFAAGLWDGGRHHDLVEALHLGVMCTKDSLSIRPTMKRVVQRLKELQPSTPPSQ